MFTVKHIGFAGCITNTLLLMTLPENFVKADEYDAMNFYVAQSFNRDENIFRLPNDIDPSVGSGQRDDVLAMTSVNGHFDKFYSLQRLVADVTVVRNTYREYDYLDHTATSAALAWKWALGKSWSGELSGSQSEAMRGFADSGNTERSINTYRKINADINYWWHPEWSAGVGAARVASRYSDSESNNSEYDEDTVEFKFGYRPPTLNLISLVASQTDGTYPNRDPLNVALFDGGYIQRNLQFRGDWRFTGHSRISGYVGGSERTYPHMSERDFTGVTGRLSYDWAPTGKLNVNVLARREIGAEIDLVDNFVVTSAVSGGSNWAITSDINLGAGYEWRRRSYGGDPRLGVDSRVGKDDVTQIARLNASYKILRNLKFVLSYQHESRSSDNDAFDYGDDIAGMAVQYNW